MMEDDEIEITPEMIEAGAMKLLLGWSGDEREGAASIYRAMEEARRGEEEIVGFTIAHLLVAILVPMIVVASVVFTFGAFAHVEVECRDGRHLSGSFDDFLLDLGEFRHPCR